MSWPGGTFTTQKRRDEKRPIRELVRRVYGDSCYYCGSPWDIEDHFNHHLDHFVPLSRGGEELPENLVPCCKPCNISKGHKLPEEFRRYVTAGEVGMPRFTDDQKTFLRETFDLDLDAWIDALPVTFPGEGGK